MNIDFHYYATYLAARIANYADEDAQMIAYAAQYVDESTEDMIDMKLLPGLDKSTPTTESMGKILTKNMQWIGTDSTIKESEQIWTSFHFLPGNIDEKDDLKAYTGDRKWGWPAYEYGNEEKRAFSLMCQPNSTLCEKMVNRVVQYKQEPYFLKLLGICMHVLADTWAHRYFAGTPSWWVNNAPDDVFYVSNGKKIEYTFVNKQDGNIPSWDELFSDNYFLATPPMASFKSFAYLGHGRMGGIPDVPFMRYRYKPQWSNEDVVKDNPTEFMLAFRQMVYAMICVQEGYLFERDTYAEISTELQDTLNEVLCREDYLASKAAEIWQPVITQFYSDASLPAFDKNLWKNQAAAAAAEEMQNTDYYHFNCAAGLHQSYVVSNIDMESRRGSNAQPVKRGEIDDTDYVILMKGDNENKWRYAATHIDFLSHNGSLWSAQYIKGRFYLYAKGKKENSHTSDQLDYLGWNKEKNNLRIQNGKFAIRDSANEGEFQEVSEIQYTAWNGEKCIASLAVWENTDNEYLNGDFREMNLKLFLLKKQDDEINRLSPKIPFLSIQDNGDKKEYIFEYIFQRDMRPRELFRVNSTETNRENVLMPIIKISADGENNDLLEINENQFLVNDQEKDSINLMEKDGSQTEISVIDWKDF
jgi:hypothetical protein